MKPGGNKTPAMAAEQNQDVNVNKILWTIHIVFIALKMKNIVIVKIPLEIYVDCQTSYNSFVESSYLHPSH